MPKVTRKTQSEALFESFCRRHLLDWSPIPTGVDKTPDYRLQFGSSTVLFEIEQIESVSGFLPDDVSSRTVGARVRQKIADARRQMQVASKAALPAVLLIYNTVDPLQAFGTEAHDFVCAMYGELTVRLVKGKAGGSFLDRNATLRRDANTSFSGVGHLKRFGDTAEVTIFENIYAANALPFDAFPPCFEIMRIEVEHAA
ncbi:MAG: hypothetical protein AB7I06_02835 [Burkholderiales bacterium]